MGFGNINERVLSEVKRLYPATDTKYIRWERIKTLEHYMLVKIIWDIEDTFIDPVFLALHDSDKCLYLRSPENFLDLLKEEKFKVQSKNYAEIVDLFGLINPKKMILESIWDLERPGILINSSKGKRIQHYRNMIQPPVFNTKDSTWTILFWVVDLSTGDLEQWSIFYDDGGTFIKSWVLDTRLIIAPVIK